MRRFATTILLILAAVCLIFLGLLSFFTWQASDRERETRQQAAPATGRFVRAGDVELFIQEMGPATGPAVLFIHGTGAWSELWREPLTALAKAGYRAIAIDVPPFGFSEKPTQPRYSSADQARRIVGLVHQLGLSRVTLVGHSFGCRATIESASHLVDQIQALVLIDAAVGLTSDQTVPDDESLMSKAASRLFGVPLVRRGIVASTVTNPLLTRRLFQLLIHDPDDATDDLVTMLQRPLVVRDSTVRLSDWMQTFLFGDDAAALSEKPATYRSFAPPTLLLWGEHDQLTPLAQAYQLQALLPDPTLVILKGVGHIPQVEDVKQFTEALLVFLKKEVPVA
jgi:pimeloyl-ACP methyl ester carboxylesterase